MDTATSEIYTLSLHDALPIFMIQSFASMGITMVMWWLVGYSLCFSGGADGIYGNFHLAFLRNVGIHSIYAPSDRKSTRLNSSHANISYAVFCLKKKKNTISSD